MFQEKIPFILPVGYEDDSGVIHREGYIRPTTALDEIKIHENELIYSRERYHDILLLSQVIVNIGEISPISPEIIEDMYEVDFRYLQALYQEVNGHIKGKIKIMCPECDTVNTITLSNIYKDLEFYYAKKETAAGEQ